MLRIHWFQVCCASENEFELCCVTAAFSSLVLSWVLMTSYPVSVLRAHQPDFSLGAAFFTVYDHSVSGPRLASALIGLLL